MTYTLPATFDLDGDPVTISFINGATTILGFVTLSGSTITFSPTLSTVIDYYVVEIILNDGITS